ncbi:unnamed protein product [Darwinula stevensoni]|uniref:Single-pass membrane and coiled-coil domain-containing protein 4 homolog n=1 Tax=Darwinula stevensoni TaxID=69355 RepID=A0A7R9AA16_9CRUS|nr:unnamed protein product [Darwinula stevensoni]CAG0897719.1 unnamed protein product [Darwinula stevensoni]
MPKLRGKPKENARQKRERKADFMENKQRALKIGIPIFIAFWVIVAIFVYLNTRPKVSSISKQSNVEPGRPAALFLLLVIVDILQCSLCRLVVSLTFLDDVVSLRKSCACDGTNSSIRPHR